MLGGLARRVATLAFGGNCYLCRGAAEGVLCAACDADLPRLAGGLCPRCALPRVVDIKPLLGRVPWGLTLFGACLALAGLGAGPCPSTPR